MGILWPTDEEQVWVSPLEQIRGLLVGRNGEGTARRFGALWIVIAHPHQLCLDDAAQGTAVFVAHVAHAHDAHAYRFHRSSCVPPYRQMRALAGIRPSSC